MSKMVQLTPWVEENGTLASLRGVTIWSMSKVEFSVYVSVMSHKMADLSLQRKMRPTLSHNQISIQNTSNKGHSTSSAMTRRIDRTYT